VWHLSRNFGKVVFMNNFSLMKSKISRLLPVNFRTRLSNFLNSLSSNETIKESKNKWNRLAKENARYVVMTDFGEGITEEQFRSSGKKDYDTLVKEDEIFHSVGDLGNRKILEIGCGIGRITEFLSDAFGEVSGVDISEEMIQTGRKRLTDKMNVHLHSTNGLDYPFPDESFDIVFSFITFQHMPDKNTVKKNIEEIARVLKKDGIAKIQLRGLPTKKSEWFYGPSFIISEVEKMIKNLPLQMIKTTGEGQRYFWVWFKKQK